MIVFCDGYSVLYGAQRSLLTLHAQFQREGRYRLHFVCMEDGDLAAGVRSAGIPVTLVQAGPLLRSYGKKLLGLRMWELPRVALELWGYAGRLKRLFREIGADLLHCNSDRAGLLHFLGARRAGIPHVNHIRRECSFGRLDAAAYNRAKDVIWVSQRVRSEFGKRNGISEPKGRVIYNGRDLRDASGPSTRGELLAEFSLPADALLAVTVAGFDECKDHENLVRAAQIVCRAEPRAYVLLAGMDQSPDQSRLPVIRRLVSEAGLEGRVLFLGHRTDIGRLMRGVDILVNPSREEALGGALIEAMGYGLPVVATDTGGTAEIVPPDQCGRLVPRQDSAALAQRMLEVLRDEALRAKFSGNARRHFAEHFTVQRCAARTAELFDDVMRRFPRRGG